MQLMFGFFQQGKIIIDFIYDEASDFGVFGRDWSLVTLNDKLGIIDRTGNEIIPSEMDDIQKEDSHLLKMEKDSKIAYYDLIKGAFLWKEVGF